MLSVGTIRLGAAPTGYEEALAQVRKAEADRIATMEHVAPSVVCIFDANKGGGGSGVVITEDGYGLTNFHVVAGMMDKRAGLGGMADGELYDLSVLGIDPTGDVAMFRLEGRDAFPTSPMGNSDTVQVGDWVFAMGNPFVMAEDYTPTVTYGLVSGVRRYQFGSQNRLLVYTDCIQVDASINPGNSGGPLYDMSGQLIGINGRASFVHRGRVNVGAGYAISINQIKRFIPGLRAGLLTEHGSLGATVVDLGFDRVVFERMLEPSVASAAGIEVGDRLIEFDGRPIHSANDFANILGVYPAFWPVTVTFEHEGQVLTKRVRLERLTVPMEKPFEVDERINTRETQRVLQACRDRLGVLPEGKRLTWRGECREHAVERDEESVTISEYTGRELSRDRQELTLKDVFTGKTRTYVCTGRDAIVEDSGNDDRNSAAVTDVLRDQLNLWLVARSALYRPVEGDESRWSHRGGDAWMGEVVDRLAYASSAGRDVYVCIDPLTHEPVRVIWQPIDVISRENPLIELEPSEFRAVDGVPMPHRLRTFVNGELRMDFRIDTYVWEGDDAEE